MSKTPKILFRTIGGRSIKKQIGLGHIYRCINLAKNLKNTKIFFLVEDYGGAKDVILNSKFKNISILNKNLSVDSDYKFTKNFIEKNNIDLVIVDKYRVSLSYLKQLNQIIKTVVISDLQKIDFPVNLVINGFVGFKNSIKQNKFGAKCLLGPKYQILNENFSKQKSLKDKREYTLLATFGGLDGHNISESMYEPLSKYGKLISTKIILGPIAKKSSRLARLQKKFPDSITLIQKTNDMFAEMSNCHYGLCSGGLTTYEFAKLGIPFGIISQVRHQLSTAQQWEELGIATNLGLISTRTPKKIEHFIEAILSDKIPQKKTSLVDGLGSKRVGTEIVKLIKSNKY